MITIMLVILIATLSFAVWSYVHRIAVRTELDLLYSACTFVQQCARADGKRHAIVFNQAYQSYQFDDQQHRLLPDVMFGVIPGAKGPPGSPTAMVRQPITFSNQEIGFSADGIATSGTIYLVDIQKQSSFALSCAVGHYSHFRKYGYRQGIWVALT